MIKIEAIYDTLLTYLPTPQLDSLEYTLSIDTIDSTPYVVVSLESGYPLFSSAIPLMDVFYLVYPPNQDDDNSYHVFEPVQTLYLSAEEVDSIAQESINTLASSMSNFLEILETLATDD